jgi:tRNA (cmo5U34)-methyltransferase
MATVDLMAQFHFDADSYLALVTSEMPAYWSLQDAVARAAARHPAATILDLGAGTGVTGARVLAGQPGARYVGIDESADMLAAAREALPAGADLRVGRLEDPLPGGPFDLVVSALAVHHLDAEAKADLFRRVADVVPAGGHVVVGDVIVPDDPADALTPLEPGFDMPSPVADQLAWLDAAGFDAATTWQERDLAVLVGVRRA